MKFEDLFMPARPQVAATLLLRKVRKVEDSSLMSGGRVCIPKTEPHTLLRGGVDTGIQPSAPSAAHIRITRPPLIPTEAPWQDGVRHQEAGAWEIAKPHFECYHADPAGPWIRRHGVILAVTPRYEGFNAR